MPEQSNDYRVVVFGAGGVGKSSLVLRFVKGTFRDTYIPTVEDTYRQVISCDKSVCTLQITDTTGSHQFPAMQRLSISKGHAFILVYSITSKQSLEELKPIYQQVTVSQCVENHTLALVHFSVVPYVHLKWCTAILHLLEVMKVFFFLAASSSF